jgi:arylsulfatase A
MKILPFLVTNLFAKEKPNVIILITDDMGIGDLSVYNKNGKILTPNIDKLAEGGVRFLDAHSGSSRCAPSRYNLMNGRYNLNESSPSKVNMRTGTPHLGKFLNIQDAT